MKKDTRNPKVLAMVERKLKADPKLGSGELFRIACDMDPKLKKLKPLQFHGKYTMAIRRMLVQGTLGDSERRAPASKRSRSTAIATVASLPDSREEMAEVVSVVSETSVSNRQRILRALFSDVAKAGLLANSKEDFANLMTMVEVKATEALRVQ